MAVIAAEIERRALAAVQIIARMATVRAAYLFGSHVEGHPDQWSDIDIAVFMDGIETWDIERRASAMAKVQLEAGIDVEAHLFPAANLDHPEPASFTHYILHHGIQLTPDAKSDPLRKQDPR